MADYTVGDVLPFAAATTDPDGQPADVGSMSLSVVLDAAPVAGSPFSVAPDVVGSGLYSQDVVATGPGVYQGYWLGAGANAGAWKQRFRVSSVADYLFVGLDEVKDFLKIPATSTDNDRKLEGFLASATLTVESHVGPVMPRTITERHWGDVYQVLLRRPPILSVTSVVGINVTTTVQVADLDVDEMGHAGYKLTTILPTGRYLWTYLAGRRGEVAEDLADAVKMIVRERWISQRGASGVPGAAAMGEWTPTQRDPLSPLVQALIRPYELPKVG